MKKKTTKKFKTTDQSEEITVSVVDAPQQEQVEDAPTSEEGQS
jgi:hypothetical protein